VKRQKDAFAIKCIKEFVDDNILPSFQMPRMLRRSGIPLREVLVQGGALKSLLNPTLLSHKCMMSMKDLQKKIKNT